MENLSKGKHESEPQVGVCLCACVAKKASSEVCYSGEIVKEHVRRSGVDSHMVFIVSFCARV